MFGFGRTRAIEKEMADWLAHPAEFGVPPKTVRLKRTYRGEVIITGAVEIHLVEYEMPDGTTGRGFVNGSLTWSFLGDEVNAIADDDLMTAYWGWAWLFPALQAGNAVTDFPSLTEGTSRGKLFICAGNTESEVAFDAADPKSALPPIYFLLGREVIRSMR
jgi:hypothetical protein